MIGFNNTFEDILGSLTQPTTVIEVVPVNQRLEEFKQWVVTYVQEHDKLEPHHSTLQQLQNMSSLDEIEQLLRHNHDYCDDCMLKLYRGFASGDGEGSGCGCDRCQGEDSEEAPVQEPPPGGS